MTEEQTRGPERTLLPQQAGEKESFALTGEVKEKDKGGGAMWVRDTPGQ